jgi:hypothetical protein
MPVRFLAAVAFSVLALGSAPAQRPTVAHQDDPPPADLADPIEALIAAGGERVSEGGATLEFWWVKSMPLAPASTTTAWTAVEEGTLVGAVLIAGSVSDARGHALRPGIYTLRYAVQPQSGSRTAAPGTPVLLLCPVGEDSSPAALGHDQTVALARQSVRSNEPAEWRLDASAQAEAAGGIRRARGASTIAFAVPVSRDGTDAGILKFAVAVPIAR